MTRVAPGSHSTHNSFPSLGRNVGFTIVKPTFVANGGSQKSIGVVTFRHPEGPQGPPQGLPGEPLEGSVAALGVPWGA